MTISNDSASEKELKIALLGQIEIEPRLPTMYGPDRGEQMPSDLIGAKIIKIGALSDARHVEGGGLAIDYVTNCGLTQRVIFASNDLALWLVYTGPRV